MSVSKEKLFGLLTICRKAGRMTMGFDSVKESILTDKAKAVFLASDISAKTEKEVTKGYIINGFKHFTQLATEYFPNHASCSSARKSMREKIDENLSLKSELEKADYTEHTIILSPKMQQIIWAHWGPPLISLPDSCPNESHDA